MILDARGLRCPWPVVRLARALRETGEAVTIVADDPLADAEIAAFARETNRSVSDTKTALGRGVTVGPVTTSLPTDT